MSGRYSVVDVFDQINGAPGSTEVVGLFTVFGKLRGFPSGKAAIAVGLYPEGDDTPEYEVIADLEDVKAGDIDVAMEFAFVKLTRVGRYYIRVYYNQKRLDDNNKYFFNVKR